MASRAAWRAMRESTATTRPLPKATSRRPSTPVAGSMTWPPVRTRSKRMGGSSGVDSSDRASGVGRLARLSTADDVTGDDRGQPDDDADDQPGAASGRISYRVGNHGGRDDDDAGDGHPRPR